MLSISNEGIIELSRGDYAEIPLFINQGNKLMPIRYCIIRDQGAVIHFGVRKLSESFDCASIKKMYNIRSDFTDQKDIIIKLVPEDTLKLSPGKYFYSVKVSRPSAGGYSMITAITDKPFIIKE